MAMNRPVNPGEEEVEFRPLPGQEEEWAELRYVDRSRAWDYLGTYPVGIALALLFLFIGMSI